MRSPRCIKIAGAISRSTTANNKGLALPAFPNDRLTFFFIEKFIQNYLLTAAGLLCELHSVPPLRVSV